jgi:hypothetical protein
LFVVEHNRCAAVRTNTKLQRSVRILVIERHAVETGCIINFQIVVVEKDDVGRVLACDSLADRTMTGMVVDGFVIGMGVDVLAPA